jgi:hypothetical protein
MLQYELKWTENYTQVPDFYIQNPKLQNVIGSLAASVGDVAAVPPCAVKLSNMRDAVGLE